MSKEEAIAICSAFLWQLLWETLSVFFYMANFHLDHV